jgi:ferritin-like metal-binding protein YciE
MKRLNHLHSLYLDALKDVYNAESQIIKALPKMIKAATAPALKDALMHHLDQTREQAARVEQIFEMNGLRPKGKKCLAMEGLIDEGKEMLTLDAEPPVLDAAIIAAAQKIEHYEIATYGTLRTWAQLMGHHDQVSLLQEILNEEKMADEHLTSIAERVVNFEADQGGDDMHYERSEGRYQEGAVRFRDPVRRGGR